MPADLTRPTNSTANKRVRAELRADLASHGRRRARGPPCTWDLILIRVLRQASFPQDRSYDLGERCTAGDRCEPLGSDGVWTKPGAEGGVLGLSGRGRVCAAAAAGSVVSTLIVPSWVQV
jgi:hypothetical protein